jgi:hypothetical protein
MVTQEKIGVVKGYQRNPFCWLVMRIKAAAAPGATRCCGKWLLAVVAKDPEMVEVVFPESRQSQKTPEC